MNIITQVMMKNNIFFKRQGSSIKFQVPWKFKDVFIVISITYLSIIFLYPLVGLFLKISGLFLKDGLAQRTFLLYLYDFVILFTPIFWIKKFYKAKIETLGIKKGRWPIPYIIIIGIGSGIGCYFITSAILGNQLKINPSLFDNFNYIILSKLTFSGVNMFLLTPISEEIIDRGFLYGFLRCRFGVLFGLFIQAIIFTLFHPWPIIRGSIPLIIQKFFLGLVYGILYEISGSLYPSIICHGVFNFL